MVHQYAVLHLALVIRLGHRMNPALVIDAGARSLVMFRPVHKLNICLLIRLFMLLHPQTFLKMRKVVIYGVRQIVLILLILMLLHLLPIYLVIKQNTAWLRGVFFKALKMPAYLYPSPHSCGRDRKHQGIINAGVFYHVGAWVPSLIIGCSSSQTDRPVFKSVNVNCR